MILNHEIYVKTWNLSHFNVILNLFFLLWQHDASTRRKTFWVILMWKDLLVWIVIKTFTFTYILVTDLATEMTTNQMISAVIDGATSLAGRKLQSRINGWEKITSEKGFKFHQGKKKCLRDLSEGPRIDHYFLRGSANQLQTSWLKPSGRAITTIHRVSEHQPKLNQAWIYQLT